MLIKRRRKSPEIIKEEAKKVLDTKALVDVAEDELEKEFGVKGILSVFSNDNIDSSYSKIPPVLTDIPSKELGNYFHTAVQNKVYIRSVLCQVESLKRQEINNLQPIKAKVFSKFNSRVSITEKELALHEDIEAKKILNKISILNEKVEILTCILKNFEDIIFDLSREVSRREGDFAQEGRIDSINNKKFNKRGGY